MKKRNKLTLNMQMGKESMQSRKPMILVLAGPNGSGKSTITAFFDKVGKYTNADDVKVYEMEHPDVLLQYILMSIGVNRIY